jgi:hypothetical protein
VLVVVISGGSGQTQGPEGTTPPFQPPETAPAEQERAPGLPVGPAGIEETQTTLAQSYNASLRLPVAGLKPRTDDVEWHVGGEGGCTYASSGNPYTWWSTPLYLPQGAIIRYFRMYYNDQNPSVGSYAFLTVYDMYGQVVEEWRLASLGTGMDYVTTGQLDHAVDNNRYTYAINWRPNDLGSDMQVCGFRIWYQSALGAVDMPPIEPITMFDRTLRIHGGALKPRTSDVEWFVGNEGGCTYASGGDPNTWWSLPLYLPQGTDIKGYRMYYDDRNLSVNCWAFLTVYDMYGRLVEEWGLSSSGTGETYASTPVHHIVDYDRYTYAINWRPNDLGYDMQVCAFMVVYRRPRARTYLPSIGRDK